ncbi:MAG: hypothetical protein KIS77_10875 [Saprospiraceae bacterium]|nr:hypothetical protein [Saprospiraceae bacterium]
MFSNYLAAPFVLATLLLLYLAWERDANYAVWMIPFVVSAAVIYIFAPQINWWWYSRRPPQLEPSLIGLLERFSGFYQKLSAPDKKKFRDRIVLTRMGTDWEPMAFEDESVPPDVQFALAIPSVMLTFRREKFLLEKFEKVVVFPRPFATPEYPYDHASELYAPDGCLLFSAEQVMRAFAEPQNWYNVALHEYAKAYALSYPDEPYPPFSESDVWEKLETASKMPRQHIESVIGIAGVDALPVAIHHYFSFPASFQSVFPDEAATFQRIFG